jgi:uncharacterized membrane protein YqhA
MKKRDKFYFLFGVVLIMIALVSSNLFASPIDNVNISFEKNDYSVVRNNNLKVNFVIHNNNSDSINLLIYSSCDSDMLKCDYSNKFE